jgi:hypothetical protein
MALGMALSAAMAATMGCGRSAQRQDEPLEMPAGGEAAGGSYSGTGGAASVGGAAPSGGAEPSGSGGSPFMSAGSSGSAAGGAGPDVTSYRCFTSSDCPQNGVCTVDGFCTCPAATPTFCPLYSVDFQAPGCASLLSNPGRCGDCGTACPAYTACRGGVCSEPPTLLAELGRCTGAQSLAIAGTQLYWSATSGGLATIPIEGGAVGSISVGSVLDLAVDESGIYWLAAGEGNSITRLAPTLDQTAEVLVSGTAAQPIGDITVHGGTVYYLRGAEIHALSSGANGWEDSVIVASPPGGLPQWLVVGDDFVIWYDHESLQQEDLLPGSDGYQHLTPTFANGIALDGEHVYWWRGELVDRLKPGTTQSELVARVPGEDVQHLAFGAEHLYIAGWKTIYRQSRQPGANGEPTPIETHTLAEAQVTALAVSSEHLYWVAACKLQRLPL